MSTLFIALAIGIAAYILFIIAVPKAVPKGSDDYLREALDRLAEENRAAEQARSDVLRDQLSDAPPLVRALMGSSLMRPLYESALAAGYQTTLEKIPVLMLMSFGISLMLLLLLGFGSLGIIMAVALAYLLPLRHCRKIIKKRNQKFIDQFPDALDMIVRSVRSGFRYPSPCKCSPRMPKSLCAASSGK